MLTLLVRWGAELNAADGDGQTPLHYAALCEQVRLPIHQPPPGVFCSIDVHASRRQVCQPRNSSLPLPELTNPLVSRFPCLAISRWPSTRPQLQHANSARAMPAGAWLRHSWERS